jgi:opacity protein-like surface antigen
MRASIVLAILLAVPGLSYGQRSISGDRAESWEFSVGAIYQDGERTGGDGGSSLQIDSEIGLAFNIGYNFSDKLALSGDFDYLRPDYTAVLADATDPTNTRQVSHSAEQFNARFKGTYNFVDGPVTPFVEIGFGWTYLDSNVVSGPPVTGCWYHPLWGYICQNYYNTFSSTEFSYGASVGVRFELGTGSFIRASYSAYELDISGDAVKPELTSYKLEYGWRF